MWLPSLRDVVKEVPVPIWLLMLDSHNREPPVRAPSSASFPEPLNVMAALVRKLALFAGLVIDAVGGELAAGATASVTPIAKRLKVKRVASRWGGAGVSAKVVGSVSQASVAVLNLSTFILDGSLRAITSSDSVNGSDSITEFV